MRHELIEGDCVEELRHLPDASIEAVITDPPYPEIDREYGRWTEEQWHWMMRRVVKECKRVLVPWGSMMFVLQANGSKVGRMRPWLWEFMAWVARNYGIVQDVYWWNFTAIPTTHSMAKVGLMRPSVKTLVWVGPDDCYRDQDEVLWTEAQASRARYANARAGLVYQPSGHQSDYTKCGDAAQERGGVTPFNLLPLANSASNRKHPSSTPMDLMRWWVRYICPDGGTVLDPFAGHGTIAEACEIEGRNSLMIEQDSQYCDHVRERIEEFKAKG